MITHEIALCIGASSQGKKAIVKCHDTGISLNIKLETFRRSTWGDMREPYIIPEGSTAIIKIAKPDKTYAVQDGVIVNASTVSFVFDEEKTPFTVAGVSRAEVSLYGANGRRITSATFSIEVETECICDCNEESGSYVDVFAEQLKAATEAADKVAEDAAAGKFDGKDGEKGEKGDKGDKGDPYTLTEDDKQEIVDDVLGSLPYTEKAVVLRDAETGRHYSLCVSEGKLTMSESESGTSAIDAVTLIDEATSLRYSLYVSGGQLMMKESEE